MYIWFSSLVYLFLKVSFYYKQTLYKSGVQEIYLRSTMAFSEEYGLVFVMTSVTDLFHCLLRTHPRKKCKAEKK